MTLTFPIWLEPTLLGIVALAFLAGVLLGAYLTTTK